MLLVNAGTNMLVPSARITAVDPRGGAAVLGDNGVGKTTTLRIMPLFFGHLLSQIVAAGHGQEAMIRFVIPTDANAIAFEYRRGSSDESDLRLAVIRRRPDDPDTPFYRIYRCGYRKDLFVSEGRFLPDEETQAKAIELGIQAASKLTTADYRSVILLHTPSSSKDGEKLRRYGVEHSFGPKRLNNLDRVNAREERAGLIARWKTWVEAGGALTVERLRAVATQTDRQSDVDPDAAHRRRRSPGRALVERRGGRAYAILSSAFAKFYFDTTMEITREARIRYIRSMVDRVRQRQDADNVFSLEGEWLDMDWTIKNRGFYIQLDDYVAEAQRRARRVARAEASIQATADVMRGEPVFVGARVPIANVLAFKRAGFDLDQLQEAYAFLTPELLEDAETY